MTYSLLIDTSSSLPIISLNRDDISIASEETTITKDLSSFLFPSIYELLEKNNLTASDLSFISVGTGPGSYTGIRVGVAAAKALSFSLDIPLIGFCSLKCFIPTQNGSFYSIFDAKSGGIYLLEGEKNLTTVIYKNKPILIPFSNIEEKINRNYKLVSPHMTTLKEKLKEIIIAENSEEAPPNKSHLAKLCFYKYKNKNFTLSDKLELLYLRGPKPIAL